jgi:hypothetical protein
MTHLPIFSDGSTSSDSELYHSGRDPSTYCEMLIVLGQTRGQPLCELEQEVVQVSEWSQDMSI